MNTGTTRIHMLVLILVIGRITTITTTTTTITTTTATTTESTFIRWKDFMDSPTPITPLLPCSDGGGETCLIIAHRPMDWRSAHHFCRSEGGFLIGHEEVTRSEIPQMTLGNVTWTGLGPHEGRLQWMTRRPALGQFLNWSEGKEGRCASLHLPSQLLHPTPCSSLLPFLCLLPSHKEEMHTSGDVELRVEVDGGGAEVVEKDGWVRVREEDLHLISLTCTAYLYLKGVPASFQPEVFWSKDGVYLPVQASSLIPAIVHDPTKSHVTTNNTSQLLQGTYWCEAWLSHSPARLVSNKVLLTLEGHEVLLLRLHERRSSDTSPSTTHSVADRVHDVLTNSLPDFKNVTIDVVSIVTEDEDWSEGTVVTSRVQVHLSSSSAAFRSLLNMVQDGRNVEDLLEKAGFLTPEASLPTRCRTWMDERSNITWPFSEVGKVQPLHYRCEAVGGGLLAGHCRWNYTQGAAIHFDSRECQRLDFCPRGYTGLAGVFCVSLTPANAWDESFHEAYISKNVMSVLDMARLHEADVGLLSLYQEVQQWLAQRGGGGRVWLPARRLAPFGPISFLGPGTSEYPIKHYGGSHSFNVSWMAGQPSSEQNCLALDTKTSLLLSLPCSVTLPFLTVLDMRGLFAVPSQEWQSTAPNLLVNNQLCPGWNTSGYPGSRRSCFQVFKRKKGLRWNMAAAFCAEQDAHLPDPSYGFLDWFMRQYLYNYRISSVWIRLPPHLGSPEETSGAFLNWRVDADPSLHHTALTTSGWIYEDYNVTKTFVICQKSVKVPEAALQVSKVTGIVRVEVRPSDTSTVGLPRCYVNGRQVWVSQIYNHSTIQDGVMKVDSNTQGYYECWVWVNSPLRLIKSNVLLYTRADTLIFSVTVADHSRYNPVLHDATFDTEASFLSHPCVDNFLKQLRESLTNASFHVTANNLYYSPEDQTDVLLLHFHVEFEFLQGYMRLTEDEANRKVAAALKQLSDTSCRAISVKSTTGCYKETQKEQGQSNMNLTWPATQGAVVLLPKELCVTEEGDPVTRECLGDFVRGYHWGIRSGECTDHPLNVTRKLWQINQVTSPSDPADLAALTAQGDSLTAADVHFVAQKINSLSHESLVWQNDLDYIVETLNNVMEAEDIVFREVQRVLNTSSILVEAFENISLSVQLPRSRGDQPLRSDRKLVSVERLDLVPNSSIIGYQTYRKDEKKEDALLVKEKEEEEEEVVRKGSEASWKHSKVTIILPGNLTQQIAEETAILNDSRGGGTPSSKVQIMFAVYRNSKLFQDNSSFPNHTVDGHIIQATYGGRNVAQLEHPVKIYFKMGSSRNYSKCVFWDFKKNEGHGGWSTAGCWSGGRHGDHWQCLCSHLTCFAQLVNFDEKDVGDMHMVILDVISLIGCLLSIVSLLLVLATFFLFQKWRRRLNNKILANLAFAILCSLVVFLAGIDQTLFPLVCRGVAVALHYFILASFGWMLVEAVHQYLKFVKVVGTYIPRFIWKASVCAWGMPFVPIIAVLVYDSALYDSNREDKICWMSSTAFRYAFVPPLAITMTINVVLFVRIIHATTCGRVRVTSTLSERQLHLTQLRMVISVFFLLGFTWVFGLLTFWQPNLVFSYLFCISNTLQGFCIFLFHVFRERDSRRLWRDFLSVISKGSSASEAGNSFPTPRYSDQPSRPLDNSNSVSYNQHGDVCFNPRGPRWDVVRGSIRSARTVSTLTHSRNSMSPVE